MSIAVSVFVAPSRIHRLLLGGCALAQLGTAIATGPLASGKVLGAPWIALLPALGAALFAVAVARRPKTHRIDISGTGDLRVTVQQDVGAASVDGAAASLLPGSVVWPVLAVLRYGVPGAPASTLPVWRDSVDAAGWRALAVALAVIGRRTDAGMTSDKIR